MDIMSTFDPFEDNDIDFEWPGVEMKMAPVLNKTASERSDTQHKKKEKKTTFTAKQATLIKKDPFLIKDRPKRSVSCCALAVEKKRSNNDNNTDISYFH
jgi:hypothetical protein